MLVKDEHLQEILPATVNDFFIARSVSTSKGEPSAGPVPGKLPGLDLEPVLNGLNGNWELLRSLLKEFREEYRDAPSDYRKTLEHGDSLGCLAKLHSLKGAAGVMGATRLPDAIADLEIAIKAQADHGHWEVFEAALDELLHGIDAA